MLCYIAVNEVQKGVVEIINVKAQAVFYLSTLLGGLGECDSTESLLTENLLKDIVKYATILSNIVKLITIIGSLIEPSNIFPTF